MTPIVTQHERIAVQCPNSVTRALASVPKQAQGILFGPRLHVAVIYLITFKVLSYGRLQAALFELFDSNLSRDALRNQLRLAPESFHPGHGAADLALLNASVIASETGVRIEWSSPTFAGKVLAGVPTGLLERDAAEGRVDPMSIVVAFDFGKQVKSGLLLGRHRRCRTS
ncbi:hypothetical protein FV233_28965 [Methylobacterium sp. WL7]|nr:hypothetical protein FV233_28965 [Methylobacterium sp. WL7]